MESQGNDTPEPKSINLNVADCKSSILSRVDVSPTDGGRPAIMILSGLISYGKVHYREPSSKERQDLPV